MGISTGVKALRHVHTVLKVLTFAILELYIVEELFDAKTYRLTERKVRLKLKKSITENLLL